MAAGQRQYLQSVLGDVSLQRPQPFVLYEVAAQNLSGGNLWLHVFNADAQPPDGTVAEYHYRVSDGGLLVIAPPSGLSDLGRPFGVGLYVGWCSTALWVNEAGPFGDSMIFAAGRDAR